MLALLGIAGLYAGYRAFVRPFLFIDFDPMPFASDAWKSSEADFSWDSVRLRMADDLLRDAPLLGLPRAEVVELIGEPDDTDKFREYEMVYFLGLERSTMAIDGEWLVVDLDDSEIVIDARLFTD